MAQQVMLLAIEYNVDDVPPGGKAVLGALAAPVKHKNKDAAGHKFHEYALRQSGFLGEHSLHLSHHPVHMISQSADKYFSRRTCERPRCA
jgi:hypothetical protein